MVFRGDFRRVRRILFATIFGTVAYPVEPVQFHIRPGCPPPVPDGCGNGLGKQPELRMKRRIARGSGFILLMTRTVRMEPEMPGSSSLAPAGGDSQFNRW